MLLLPPLMEKYRVPLGLIFLMPGDDQLNRSCVWKKAVFAADPKPITSSISCSVSRCASKSLEATGRVNPNGAVEFNVTIPSYGPPFPTLPSANIAGGVCNPTARPFALDGRMSLDHAVPGKLAFATASLPVFASALKAAM